LKKKEIIKMATWNYYAIDVRTTTKDCASVDDKLVENEYTNSEGDFSNLNYLTGNPYTVTPTLTAWYLAVADQEGDRYTDLEGGDSPSEDDPEGTQIMYASSGCKSFTFSATPIAHTTEGEEPAAAITPPDGVNWTGAFTLRVDGVNNGTGWPEGHSLHGGLNSYSNASAECVCPSYWGCEPNISAPVTNTTDPDGDHYLMGQTAEIWGTKPDYATGLTDNPHQCASRWVCGSTEGCDTSLSIYGESATNEPDTQTHDECEADCEYATICVPCSEEQLEQIGSIIQGEKKRNFWDLAAIRQHDYDTTVAVAKWDGDGVPADVFVMNPSPDCTCDDVWPEDFEVWKEGYQDDLISFCPTTQAFTADAPELAEEEKHGGFIDDFLEKSMGRACSDEGIPCCPDREPDSVPTYDACDGNVCGDPHVTTFFDEKYDM
jgi:hypothetical protein